MGRIFIWYPIVCDCVKTWPQKNDFLADFALSVRRSAMCYTSILKHIWFLIRRTPQNKTNNIYIYITICIYLMFTFNDFLNKMRSFRGVTSRKTILCANITISQSLNYIFHWGIHNTCFCQSFGVEIIPGVLQCVTVSVLNRLQSYTPLAKYVFVPWIWFPKWQSSCNVLYNRL